MIRRGAPLPRREFVPSPQLAEVRRRYRRAAYFSGVPFAGLCLVSIGASALEDRTGWAWLAVVDVLGYLGALAVAVWSLVQSTRWLLQRRRLEREEAARWRRSD